VRALLDTHVLLWLFLGKDDAGGRLSPSQRAAIGDPSCAVMVSVASFWEVPLKVRTGRLRVDLERLAGNVRAAGLVRSPILDAHLRAPSALPFLPDHRDPFDHLLIAQAIAEDLLFAASDRQATRYPVRLLV
jgi:PIN domain nuclease of toxin-antitoxin system